MASKKDPWEARARELLAKGRSREEVAHELELTVTELWAIATKPGTEKQRAKDARQTPRSRQCRPGSSCSSARRCVRQGAARGGTH
jgi:hypothetical protein